MTGEHMSRRGQYQCSVRCDPFQFHAPNSLKFGANRRDGGSPLPFLRMKPFSYVLSYTDVGSLLISADILGEESQELLYVNYQHVAFLCAYVN